MKEVFSIALLLLLIIVGCRAVYAGEGPLPSSESGTVLPSGGKPQAVSQPEKTKPAVGAVSPYRLRVGDKTARGVKNMLFGWTELPKKVVDITRETNNPFWGLLAGTFQGTLKAMARTASGASDVVTAPIAPEKDPFIKPDIYVD